MSSKFIGKVERQGLHSLRFEHVEDYSHIMQQHRAIISSVSFPHRISFVTQGARDDIFNHYSKEPFLPRHVFRKINDYGIGFTDNRDFNDAKERFQGRYYSANSLEYVLVFNSVVERDEVFSSMFVKKEEKSMKFWTVWNPAGRNPAVKQASRAVAQKEAERLAAANPGQEFFVMESKSLSKSVSVQTTDL